MITRGNVAREAFRALYGRVQPSTLPPISIDHQSLEGLPDDVQTERLAEQISQQSRLTIDEARPRAAMAVASSAGKGAMIAQVAEAQFALPSGSANLQLSNPKPMPVALRFVIAVVLLVAFGAAIGFAVYGDAGGLARYVVVAVLGGLAWLGAVLCVMGYQNMDLSGSVGSEPSSVSTNPGTGPGDPTS